MGVERETTVTFRCDECGTTIDGDAVDPQIGWPAGWIRLFDAGWVYMSAENTEGTLLCGWTCTRDWATGRAT